MQGEMRIALEVRLYEEVLYHLHGRYSAESAMFGEALEIKDLIRRLEVNAYEVTWKWPNRPGAYYEKPWYERTIEEYLHHDD